MTDQQSIVKSLCRACLTALTLLGDEFRAEALVADAVGSLDASGVTERNVRNAVVERLVRMQLPH